MEEELGSSDGKVCVFQSLGALVALYDADAVADLWGELGYVENGVWGAAAATDPDAAVGLTEDLSAAGTDVEEACAPSRVVLWVGVGASVAGVENWAGSVGV